MNYGTFIVDPCNKAHLVKINKIQYESLHIILGAMKSSSNYSMQVECAEPPLNLCRQYLCDKYLCKILQISSHPLPLKLDKLLQITNCNQELSFKELQEFM